MLYLGNQTFVTCIAILLVHKFFVYVPECVLKLHWFLYRDPDSVCGIANHAGCVSE